MSSIGENTLNGQEIALIGMSGRFPGASNIRELWKNLCAGIDASVAFTENDLKESGIDPDVLRDPHYVSRGALLEDADCFDAAFFGISPREAEILDPQHRVLLECAWSVIEDAGYDVERYTGLIGVFGGMARNTYFMNNVVWNQDLLKKVGAYQTMLASDKEYGITRVGFTLNLHGPCVNVQTACSTSGVAIHMACQSLLNGECDMAIAGGTRIKVPLRSGYYYEEGGIPSSDGRCRAFDARGDGTLIGSGVAMVLLKPLPDALRDRDAIYAVIKGTALNNDGSRKVGFTAPSVQGQVGAIEEALAVSGVEADTIGYVEAHGTGTAIGDPIEIAALTQAFRKSTDRKGYCRIGSIKTNIGHLDAGAGAAGVIKAALSLRHKLIPPSLHFEKPNPQIDFENSPFVVNAKLSRWESEGTPRRAGVSSFGLGGTNFHGILEEIPEQDAPASDSRSKQLLCLSAKSPAALDRMTLNLGEQLGEMDRETPLADVAYTLQVGRSQFAHRRFLVCDKVPDASQVLRDLDRKRLHTKKVKGNDPSVVFMFPGGGVQYPNMGLELYRTEKVFRDTVNECYELLDPDLSGALRRWMYPTESDLEQAAEELQGATLSILSIFIVEVALARLWMSWGIQPEATTGHSLGEYAAAQVSGILSLKDALKIVAIRGAIFHHRLEPGGMLGVPLSEREVSSLLGEDLSIAAVNGPELCVVSGELKALDRIEATLSKKGIECKRPKISAAGHSRLLDPYLDEFREALTQFQFHAPAFPMISSRTAKPITDSQAVDPDYWVDQLRNTVRFGDVLSEIFHQEGRILLESGPGTTLGSLARLHPDNRSGATILPSLRHPKDTTPDTTLVLTTLGKLWLEGVQIDWEGFYRDERRRRVHLPSYPFERTRYWIDPPAQKATPSKNELQGTGDSEPDPTEDLEIKPDRPQIAHQGALREVVLRIKTILHDLSGVEIEKIDETAHFLELGFDSLFLTQANHAFHRELGVRITFRQLLEEAPTIEKLAAYIAAQSHPIPAVQAPARIRSNGAGDSANSIVFKLKEILHQLSGIPTEEIDETRPLLELGFDSLFLTQANVAFQREFDVRITMRQIMRETPTLSQLAGAIEEQLGPREEIGAPASLESETGIGAREQIVESLRSIFVKLGRFDFEEAIESQTFLELGCDSLFLTQASAAIEREFGIVVSSRQLIEETATFEKLSEYLVGALQLESVSAGAPDKPSLHTSAAQPPAVGNGGVGALSVGTGVGVSSSPKRGGNGHSGNGAGGSNAHSVGGPDSTESNGSKTAVQQDSFGPWRPIPKSSGTELTSIQRDALDRLIARYTNATRESKRLTAAQRPYLADPRAVSHFRQVWKEMVYQIATTRSSGSRIWDVDGNEYIDLTMGFGINLLGHTPRFVTESVKEQIEKGVELGVLSPLAADVAALIRDFTGLDRVNFVTTGSEAVMAAIRAARTVTGRDRIAFFAGDYHGIFDEVLARPVKVGMETKAVPIAPGIPLHTVENALILDYEDPDCLDELRLHVDELAAVIIEPVQSRRLDRQPKEIIRAVREITERHGTALIFDELITGFRLAPGGAQEWYGVQADLAAYGKTISGGYPLAAVAGKAEFMDAFDGGQWNYGDDSFPEAGVTFFGGTFVRHPAGLAAGKATLEYLKAQGPGFYRDLNERADRFAQRANEIFGDAEAPIRLTNCGSMLHFRFLDDNELSKLIFFYLRDRRVHVWDRPVYLSSAHSDEDIDFMVRAIAETVQEMQEGGFLPTPRDPQSKGRFNMPERSPLPQAHTQSLSSLPGVDPGSGLSTRLPSNGNGRHGAFRIPITDGQMEVWLGSQIGAEPSLSFNMVRVLEINGNFSIQAMAKAYQQLTDRHEALRTTFSPDGAYQEIAPSLQVAPIVEDLSSLPDDVAKVRCDEVIDRDARMAFDLEKGPLARLWIVKLNDLEHRIVFTTHHVICDGWSKAVLWQDLGALYTANIQGKKAELQEPMQLHEYVEWQMERWNSPVGEKAEQYWLDQFSDSIPVLDLPTDRPRPAIKTYAASDDALYLSPEKMRKIKEFSDKSGCTVFTILMSAYYLLLHRLSRQDDVVVGVAVAGQTMTGNPNLVCHCVNFLPVRSRIAAGMTSSLFINEVMRILWDAFDHTNYTYGKMLRKLPLDRDPSRIPLVSAIATHETDRSGVLYEGLTISSPENPRHFCNFELEVYFRERDGGLNVNFHYNTDLFDSETIKAWLDHYETLLDGLMALPETPVWEIPILNNREKQQILLDWNQNALPLPENLCIHHLFEERVRSAPNAPAVVFRGETLTYGELDRLSNQLAHHLIRMGAGPESFVGIFMDRSPKLIVGLLGVLKSGAAYVPLDPAYPKDRIAFMLEDSRARIILSQDRLVAELPTHQAQVVRMDSDWPTIATNSATSPRVGVNPNNLAYTIYTSGSTGKPKGVAIEHRSAVALSIWEGTVYSKEELSGVLASTSICFDLSVFEIFGTLANGGKIVLVENALELLDRPEDGEIALINSVPSALRELLALGAVPQSVRTVNLAGEPLTTELADAIYNTGHVLRVYDLYGPSEDTTYSTFTLRTRGGRAIIGKPIANTQAFLLDANRQPVPIGVPGEVYLGGAGLARGYLHRPDLTAERFVPNPFDSDPRSRLYRTGDLAKYHADGNLEFLGRIDHQVKVRGFRIELGEIEARIKDRPEVDQTVVVAREDASGEKQLVAYYTAHAGASLSQEDLRASLKRSLPVYMVPSFLVPLPEFPLTPNGKIDRKALPKPENAPHTPAASAPGPVVLQPIQPTPAPPPVYLQPPVREAEDAELEQSIAQIWSEILGFQIQDIDGNFFEVGGHSLSSLRIVQLMNQRLGTHLSPMALSQHQSIRALAELVRAERGPSTVSSQPAIAPTPVAPPAPPPLPTPPPQSAPQPAVAGDSEIETTIAQVWSEILGFQVQDYDGNFFEIGGHSLSSLRALQLMNQRLGTRFSPMTISQHQTIRALADLVRAERGIVAPTVSDVPFSAPTAPQSGSTPQVLNPTQTQPSFMPAPAPTQIGEGFAGPTQQPVPTPVSESVTRARIDREEELDRLRQGLEKIRRGRSVSDRFAMRESRIAAKILRPLYRLRSSRLRKLLVKLIVKLEGDESTTKTLRRIWEEYYDVHVGEYTVGAFDLFRFRPGTTIGRYCSIARTARTETANHPMNTLSTSAYFFNPGTYFAEAEFIPRVRLRIGNDVFLGHNVHVLAPTKEIGDGAVLGSGSVVMGNVPPFAVMIGYPAHVVRYRFSKETIEEIEKNPWWEKDLDELASVKDEFTRAVEGKEVR